MASIGAYEQMVDSLNGEDKMDKAVHSIQKGDKMEHTVDSVIKVDKMEHTADSVIKVDKMEHTLESVNQMELIVDAAYKVDNLEYSVDSVKVDKIDRVVDDTKILRPIAEHVQQISPHSSPIIQGTTSVSKLPDMDTNEPENTTKVHTNEPENTTKVRHTDIDTNDPENTTKVRHSDMDIEWARRLKDDFQLYQKTGLFTDLTFMCSDGSVKAHRLILGQFSTFLKLLMVTSDSRETQDLECVIQMPELTVGEMQVFIKCVYSGKLTQDVLCKESLIKVCDIIKSNNKSVEAYDDYIRVVPYLEPKVIIEAPVERIKEESTSVDLEIDEQTNEMIVEDVRDDITEVQNEKVTAVIANMEDKKGETENVTVATHTNLVVPENVRDTREDGVEEITNTKKSGLTKAERAAKTAENLKKLCPFCQKTALDHRVRLKVRQEKNNSFHTKHNYICCNCGTVSSAPSNFLHHVTQEFSKLVQEEGTPLNWNFKCSLRCNKMMREHMSGGGEEGKEVWNCCHCDEKYPSPCTLQVHLKTVQCMTLVKCDICNIAIASHQLKKHKLQKHKEDLVPEGLDEQSMKSYNTWTAITGNKNPLPWSDMEKGLVPCQDCPRLLSLTQKDGRRKKMHHFKERHPEYYSLLCKANCEAWKAAPSSQYTFCDICNKNIRKCNMKDHKLHSHGMDLNNVAVDRPQFVCDICGHISKYAKDVRKHKKFVHERILEHMCKWCGKKFSNKGNLNQHEVIHTGITPFQCHVCGKQCRRKSELEKHIQSHDCLAPGSSTHKYSPATSHQMSHHHQVTVPPAHNLHPHRDVHVLHRGGDLHSVAVTSNTQLPVVMSQVDPLDLQAQHQRQEVLKAMQVNMEVHQQGHHTQGIKMPAFILH